MNHKSGQTVLSFALLVGLVAVIIAATFVFLTVSSINSIYGFQAANQALAVSYAGAEDALWRLSRNKDFSAITPYTVAVGEYSASVTVNQNTPTSGEAAILSDATVRFHRRKTQVVASIDAATGEVRVISWQLLNL